MLYEQSSRQMNKGWLTFMNTIQMINSKIIHWKINKAYEEKQKQHLCGIHWVIYPWKYFILSGKSMHHYPIKNIGCEEKNIYIGYSLNDIPVKKIFYSYW